MEVILEFIGEILIEGLGYYIFSTNDKSFLSFTIKTILRLLLLGVIGFVGLFLYQQFVLSNLTFLGAIALLFVILSTIYFIVLTFRSIQSIINKNEPSVLN